MFICSCHQNIVWFLKCGLLQGKVFTLLEKMNLLFNVPERVCFKRSAHLNRHIIPEVLICTLNGKNLDVNLTKMQ